MTIRRDDFREVVPTPAEVATWISKNPTRQVPVRAVHKPCGKRMWYSGIAIGSHMRACTGKPGDDVT